jgi:hypothetical protein
MNRFARGVDVFPGNPREVVCCVRYRNPTKKLKKPNRKPAKQFAEQPKPAASWADGSRYAAGA